MKRKKDVNVGKKKIKNVPYFLKEEKEMLNAKEILKIEKALRMMKKTGIEEIEYEEVLKLK